MAKSYEALEQQLHKIRSAIEKITPPKPDDELEAYRKNALHHFATLEAHVHGQVTGEGTLITPEIQQ